MDLSELEALAVDAHARANADEDDPPSAFELVRTLLGTPVRRPPHMVTSGALYSLAGKRHVAVKASLRIERAHHVAGHELAHAIIQDAQLSIDDEERAADYLGACLMMPRRYVLRFYRAEGFAPAILASEIVCTQTAAALRLGEVVGLPLAAVSPALVRVRGPRAFIWPDEAIVRRWVSRPRPGLARVRLTDEPRRAALIADEDISETG